MPRLEKVAHNATTRKKEKYNFVTHCVILNTGYDKDKFLFS